MSAPELRTERLLLDAVTPADTDAVFEYCQDEELQRFTTVPSPYTRESAEGYTGEFATNARWLWAIRYTGEEPLLGVIGLTPHELASAEIGYWLGGPHRGRGIMTEAARAVVDFGLSRTGAALDRIAWNAVVGNTASAVVAQRVCFRFEGLQRRALVSREERVDGWFASILGDDDRAPQPGWPL